jgi:ubiquinone/menaquinone biosynthesis C-methylase UbiE
MTDNSRKDNKKKINIPIKATSHDKNEITNPMRIGYSLFAHLYSFLTGSLFLVGGCTEKQWKQRVFSELLPKIETPKIIDLCCANGKGTAILSQLYPNGQITGIDLDPKMIAFANKNYQKKDNLHFQIADCSNIPFPENNFDIVTSFMALHEIPRPVIFNVLHEIKRVLKPKGLLLMFDFNVSEESNNWQRLLYKIFMIFESKSAGIFMRINHQELMKKWGFKLISRRSLHKGFLEGGIYQKIRD